MLNFMIGTYGRGGSVAECIAIHQAAKMVAALVRLAKVTAGLAECNGTPPLGL